MEGPYGPFCILKGDLWNMKNPFGAEAKLNRKMTKMTNQMSMSIMDSMVNAVMDTINGLFEIPGNMISTSPTEFRRLDNGMTLEVVHVDEKDDEADQNMIYSEFMSEMNGDRDAEYPVPENISMVLFDNDAVPEEERMEMIDTMDAINESNELERTGEGRTLESIKRETDQMAEAASEIQKSQKRESWAHNLAVILTPLVRVAVILTVGFGMMVIVRKGMSVVRF